MRVTITAGPSGCNHITVRNAADNSTIGTFDRRDIKDAWQDWRDGSLPFNFLTLACYLVNKAVREGVITGTVTAAKIKTFLESAEL